MTGSSTLGNLGLSAAPRPTSAIRHRVATRIYLHPFFTCMLALQIAFPPHKEGGCSVRHQKGAVATYRSLVDPGVFESGTASIRNGYA